MARGARLERKHQAWAIAGTPFSLSRVHGRWAIAVSQWRGADLTGKQSDEWLRRHGLTDADGKRVTFKRLRDGARALHSAWGIDPLPVRELVRIRRVRPLLHVSADGRWEIRGHHRTTRSGVWWTVHDMRSHAPETPLSGGDTLSDARQVITRYEDEAA